MNEPSRRLRRTAWGAVALAGVVGSGACAPTVAPPGPPPGSGGALGTGGSPGAGGTVASGSGGALATGGTTATGGGTSTGGTTAGAGGALATGGTGTGGGLVEVDSSCPFEAGAAPTGQDWVKGELIEFNDDGGWCWYQDERVLVDQDEGKLIIGSVASKGSRSAWVEVTHYDLAAKTSERHHLGTMGYTDDHDVPALLITSRTGAHRDRAAVV